MKLTVKEYSTAYNVSIQSVYKRIQRNTITWVEENGTKYIIIDDTAVERVTKPVQSNDCTELLDIIRRRDKEVKSLGKEIKRLTKELTKAQNGKSAVLEKFIFEMQQLSAPAMPVEEDVIEVKEAKKKNRKKKSKKKRV